MRKLKGKNSIKTEGLKEKEGEERQYAIWALKDLLL